MCSTRATLQIASGKSKSRKSGLYMGRLPAFSVCPLMSPDRLNKVFGQRSAKARMEASRTWWQEKETFGLHLPNLQIFQNVGSFLKKPISTLVIQDVEGCVYGAYCSIYAKGRKRRGKGRPILLTRHISRRDEVYFLGFCTHSSLDGKKKVYPKLSDIVGVKRASSMYVPVDFVNSDDPTPRFTKDPRYGPVIVHPPLRNKHNYLYLEVQKAKLSDLYLLADGTPSIQPDDLNRLRSLLEDIRIADCGREKGKGGGQGGGQVQGGGKARCIQILNIEITDAADFLSNPVKAKEVVASRKDIMTLTRKWMSACEEEGWLEDYNKDENRFATKGAHLNLKRAEKARAVIAKLPAMVESLTQKTISWEDERGFSFMFDGVRLLSMLNEYKNLREKKEEEKRRLRDHKKGQEQLLTEEETLFGSKPSPAKVA